MRQRNDTIGMMTNPLAGSLLANDGNELNEELMSPERRQERA